MPRASSRALSPQLRFRSRTGRRWCLAVLLLFGSRPAEARIPVRSAVFVPPRALTRPAPPPPLLQLPPARELFWPARLEAPRSSATALRKRGIKGIWYGGTRDDALRASAPRAFLMRSAAGGLVASAGLAVVVAGGSGGGRRSGPPSPLPVYNAGGQLGEELGVVVGSAVLLGGAILASAPLEGGARRLRPHPIGGARWGGMGLRWRF